MLLTPRSSPVILVNCHIPPLLNVTEFLGLPTSKPFLIGTFAFQRFCTCLHTLAQFNFIALSVIVCSSFHATVLTCIVLLKHLKVLQVEQYLQLYFPCCAPFTNIRNCSRIFPWPMECHFPAQHKELSSLALNF